MATDNNDLAQILPRPDGSLLVQGPITLLDSEGNEVETKEKFSLCRCGASGNKPFCDASHKAIDFTSEREIDRPIDRYRAYEGEEITVKDNRTICAHAQFCIHDLPTVFSNERRPWIAPDEASAEEVAELTGRCPSGALVALVEEKSRGVSEPMIQIMEDGPYMVRGPVELTVDESLTPPVPERYSLCRCGASKNKPYCDGSHLQLEEGWSRK